MLVLIQTEGKTDVSEVETIPFDYKNIFHTFYIGDHRIFDAYSYSYRAEAVDKNGDVILSIKLKPLENQADYRIRGIARKVKADFTIVARRMNGSVIYAFKKMKLKEKCSSCWDYNLESSSDSSCKECGGLGRVSYYSNPIKTYARAVNVNSESLNLVNVGQEGVGNSTISMLQDITLFTDDVFFYQSTGKWFIVNTSISASTIQNIPTLQTLSISELPSDSPQIEIAKRKTTFLEIESNKMR
ncbi:hypothetical protein JHD46_08220 [Sulfurimonas sp. SAG-AH-194-C20]|nr:hypothetical protein [Sulfurimonas sp. SAG-AH-194-C20]MDF1879620.1 hypothetical protein [Sulfurimonas sp. SAG-AH-194-C20]